MSIAKQRRKYVDLDGNTYALSGLDSEERAVFEHLQKEAEQNPDWGLFSNDWHRDLTKLYEPRGLSRREITETILWEIASDLTGRLGIAQGDMRQPDYRDDLEMLIATRFATRRAFCEATGLSEDMLSHVLARRKHLAIDTLNQALAKIGYTLHIAPLHGELPR
ncbi:MAG TPA: hypothetical protein VHZ24_08385 [Pirellulales bacterium]|jgi:hypothetical protein|nr:hypothetical protein [Pirellulales bacterium]